MEKEENISLDQVVEMLQQGKTPPNIQVIDDTPLNGTNVFPQINVNTSVNKKVIHIYI
jgi:hypothetical protein